MSWTHNRAKSLLSNYPLFSFYLPPTSLCIFLYAPFHSSMTWKLHLLFYSFSNCQCCCNTYTLLKCKVNEVSPLHLHKVSSSQCLRAATSDLSRTVSMPLPLTPQPLLPSSHHHGAARCQAARPIRVCTLWTCLHTTPAYILQVTSEAHSSSSVLLDGGSGATACHSGPCLLASVTCGGV